MRPIKFRAWDKEENKMHHCGEDTEVFFELTTSGIMCTNIRNVSPIGEGIESMDHLIYMQYTGLTDKNGKDIYEGDVYKYLITVGNGPIASKKSSYEQVKYIDGAFWVGPYLLIEALRGDEDPEVIGNIYEDKHLLEVQT